MSFSETISPFFGRCAFVWFYGAAAMNILNNWHDVAHQMDARHVPLAPVLLVVGLVLIVLGGISLLFGYHARHGAVLLFGLTIVAAFAMHDFWHVPDGPGRWNDFQIFARDIAICGGLLLIVGMGAGPFAIDNRPAGGKGGGKRR
jgi:putative oxidoreductase